MPGSRGAGKGHVFFVMRPTSCSGPLCCLWSFTRIFVRAASGRQRFNVLGAWNAVTRQLIAVTNTTVVNTETMCELLRKIAASGLTGAITLVLDNARYQHNAAVKHWPASWDHAVVPPLLVTQTEPDRTPLEIHQTPRLYGRYHPTFAEFQPPSKKSLTAFRPPRRATENTDDAQFPATRRRFTYGRVRYNGI